MKDNSILWLVGGAALFYYLYTQSGAAASAGASAAGTPFYSTQPTPYSIYPEYGYTAQTAQTSMATTPGQQAPAAVMPAPTTYFTSVQQQEQQALLSQAAGAFPGATAMMSDWQLGF